jgi:DNA (cytosine-5)-methyltransferase 1
MASGAGMSRAAGMPNECDYLVPQVAQRLTTGTGQRYDAESETLIPVAAIDCRSHVETEELSGTLQAKSTGGYSLNYQNPVRIGYTVRRLTPLEAERLQGFPDNWTEGGSDTARYKACGNSIALPPLEFIMRRIAEVLGEAKV